MCVYIYILYICLSQSFSRVAWLGQSLSCLLLHTLPLGMLQCSKSFQIVPNRSKASRIDPFGPSFRPCFGFLSPALGPCFRSLLWPRFAQVSHLPDILDASASKEPIGKVQSIVQELLVIQGEEDGKAWKSECGYQGCH